MGEAFVMHRVGGDHIKRAAQIVIQQPENAVDHIIDMDPGQILSSAADRAAEAEAEHGQHFRQHAAFRGKDHAGAQQADAGLVAQRAAGNLLPASAELMGKLIVRRLLFGHDYLTEIAVVARCRSGDQHRGRRSASLDQIHQLLGDLPAAVAQARFLRLAPAFVGNRLARQINYRVDVVEIVAIVKSFAEGHTIPQRAACPLRAAGNHRY